MSVGGGSENSCGNYTSEAGACAFVVVRSKSFAGVKKSRVPTQNSDIEWMADEVFPDFSQNSVTPWGFHPVQKLKGNHAHNV